MEKNLSGSTENHTEYLGEVTGLKPNTLYAFRIRVHYRAGPFDKSSYVWPQEETKFTHKTLVSHPDQPLPPTVNHLKSGAYEVRWEKPADNGAQVINYMLEYRNVESGTWKAVYNGSIERCLMESSKLKQGKSYIFRVAAINSQGMGMFSDNSTVFLPAPYAVESSISDHITIGVTAGIAVLLLPIILAVVVVIRREYAKKKIQRFTIRGPDTELTNLRELPRSDFQTTNTLYAMNIQCTDEEIAKLPHFSRSQLVLIMFLGSGAFGEVFEGLAKNTLGDSTGETKCAMKTLRKSASEHEKEEFLKEALLMKNFRHEHILSLLGVCLDNDPQFIMMELMEGGDLLSFLRSCRATTTKPASLHLPDLVKICVHVARECKYLQDMHFVHRDLAARNCLVSSKSTESMIVKIGDFGLARDIYKNDYYRKEGEGLLPVRWMSSESLVDGFFTTQSDIWAFGVLMWEVVTLGQQPYPARANIEVLHFVRDGGQLERPDKCADEMYSLMNKCWNFLADHRPSFAELLVELETFQEKCSRMTLAEITQYSPSVTEGGGSVRLTQAGKQRRLNDLLHSSDTPEKPIVDLTKIGRKRAHSLDDSKPSTQYSASGSRDHFPAAGEYDHNRHLEPREGKGGCSYLELINYAPELRLLKDQYGNPLVSGTGSSLPSVHMTCKGYSPSHVNYMLLPSEEDALECHRSASEGCGAEDPRYCSRSSSRDKSRHPHGLISVEESPVLSQVLDDHQHYSSSSGREFGDLSYHPQSMQPTPVGAAMMMSMSQQRKFLDQDLYSSTAPYRQRHSSSPSSSQGHGYASVECNNDRVSVSNNNFNNGSGFLCDGGGSSSSIRNRNGSSSSYHNLCQTRISI